MKTNAVSPDLGVRPHGARHAWLVQQRYAPYLFISPFLILFCVFMLYPLGRSIAMSFETSAGPRLSRFVGLAHYRFLVFDWLFWVAAANTLLFAVAFLCLQIPLSLGLAMLLNSRLVWFRNFFRFAFFSSNLVGQVFVAVLFTLMLTPRHGLINRAFAWLLPGGVETNWKDNPHYAMPAILIASLWLSIGYGMVYFLAALQSVDRELYEAASIDGAGQWSKFWNVTLPGVKPVLIFLVLVGTIASLSLFELPYVFFQGPGPGFAGITIVQYLFAQGFEVGDLGYASAVGWVLALMLLGVTIVQIRLTRVARED